MTPAKRYSFDTRYGEHSYIFLKDWQLADAVYCFGQNYRKNFNAWCDSTRIKIFGVDGSQETRGFPIELNSAVEHAINAFFEFTGGESVELGIYCTLTGKPPQESDAVEQIAEYLARRPIKVKMYKEDLSPRSDPNDPLNEFFRNYVDFQMYATISSGPPDQPPLTISDKLLKCEFLYLIIRLTNAEVLLDKFNGWGLVVSRPDPKITFEYFSSVVQKWYSGEETHWEYLCLAFNDVTYESCKPLISLGKQIEIKWKDRRWPEIEITRSDGKFCRLRGMPLNEDGEGKIHGILCFYIGDCSDGMMYFHAMGYQFI